MPTKEELEIYKQRYETYRHFDKLRWQMLQIAVGAGSVVLAFGGGFKRTRLVGISSRWLALGDLRVRHGANPTWNLDEWHGPQEGWRTCRRR